MFANLPAPLLFAHRGASLHAPENTLEAFELAARTGADVLELDVHLSRDGFVVVCHDATLERTTDGSGLVREHTLAELKRLDAGYRFERSGARPFRGRGARLPTLEEVIHAFPGVGLNIELKQHQPSMISAVLGVLEQSAPTDVLLTAGDPRVMSDLERAGTGLPLGLSVPQVREVVKGAWLRGVPPGYAGRALQIPPWWNRRPVATRRVIRRARAAGLRVHVWTLNTPRLVRRYLNLGVDGVMTDDPALMAGIMIDWRAAARG